MKIDIFGGLFDLFCQLTAILGAVLVQLGKMV